MESKTMSSKSIDYIYSLNLQKRINKFVESEPKLNEFLSYNGYNLWQAYQAILFVDIKGFSTGSQPLHEVPRFHKMRFFISETLCNLISFFSVLWGIFTKADILIFTGDKLGWKYKNDGRLNSLYESISLDKVSYFEIVHTAIGRDTFRNFLRRGRPVFYLEAIDYVISPIIWFRKRNIEDVVKNINLESFSKEEMKFIRFELIKFMSSRLISILRIKTLSFLFKALKTKIAFSIDDTRHYNEFIFAGRATRIPVFAIQHGHFTKYHVGWLKMTNLDNEVIKPDYLIVWSDYWKQELLRLGTYFYQDEIIVGGSKLSFEVAPYKKLSSTVSVLLPYETDAPKDEVLRFVNELLSNSDIEIFFKLRPDQEIKKQLEEYGFDDSIPRFFPVKDLSKIIGKIDVAIGTYSTMLYELVEMGKPVGILDTSIDYGEGMVRNGLAGFIEKNSDRVAFVRQLSNTSRAVLSKRRLKLIGNNPKNLTVSLREIINKYVSN